LAAWVARCWVAAQPAPTPVAGSADVRGEGLFSQPCAQVAQARSLLEFEVVRAMGGHIGVRVNLNREGIGGVGDPRYHSFVKALSRTCLGGSAAPLRTPTGDLSMTTAIARFSMLAIVSTLSTLSTGSALAASSDGVVAATTTCSTAKNCIDFETDAWSFTTFGTYGSATMAANVVLLGNGDHVVKIKKSVGTEIWAGVTIWSGANQTVPPMLKPNTPEKPANQTVSLKVKSNTIGRNIKMKIENSVSGAFVEVDVATTVANAWETLKFDFSKPTLGTYNPNVVYDRVSVFPGFGSQPEATETTLIDDLVYVKAKVAGPCNSGGKQSLVDGKFASDYSAATTGECGSFGFYAGPDDLLWWNGYADNVMAGGHPSHYFGFGTLQSSTWGIGGFVKAPKDGFVIVNPNSTDPTVHYKGMTFELWGNDQLVSKHPQIQVLLLARPVTMPDASVCIPAVQSAVNVAANGVQSYSLPFSGFTVAQACGDTANSVKKILKRGVTEVHAQVLKQFLNTTTDGDGNGRYPNGLNMGKITFTY
jgi:hypothetical protein